MIYLLLSFLAALEFEAEKMEILREGAGRVTHLVGSVHLFDEGLDIRGAQAWFVPQEHSLVVYDSLRIRAEDVDIQADSLWFDTEERISHLYRRVVVKREATEIQAPELLIYHRTRKAEIPSGAQIRDLEEKILVTGDEVSYSLKDDRGSIARNPRLRDDTDSSEFQITSERMYLDQRSHSASAAGGVRILTEEATVLSDTLTLYYEEDRGNASGAIAIENPDGRIEADSLYFTLSGRRLEEINLYPSVTTRYRTEGEDSVLVSAPRLLIDLHDENHETLIFTGGTSGTYFWEEEQGE